MKNRSKMAVLAALGVMVFAAGCSGKTPAAADGQESQAETQEEAEPAEEEQKEEAPAALTEEEEQDLYNLYIKVNNSILDSVSSSLSRYFSYVEYQEEFVKPDGYYDCYSISEYDFESLQEADELVAKKPEKDELDEAYMALSPVLQELAAALNEVDAYTEEESYLQDDYAKGAELHAEVWKNCEAFESGSMEFVAILNGVAAEQRAADMEMMKEEGYVVTYAFVKLISTAQEIQTAIYEQGIEDDSMMLELDTDALQPLYDQYMEEVEVVLAYLDDTEALGNEGYPTQSAYYMTFKEAVENSKAELEEIFRKVAEQEPPKDFSIANAFMVDGSISGFDSKVSAMVSGYNQMINY